MGGPQIYKKNQVPDPSAPPPVKGERPEFELKEVQELLTDAFTGAAERHIEVGDGLDMLIIHKDEGVRWVHMRQSAFPLALPAMTSEILAPPPPRSRELTWSNCRPLTALKQD